MKPVLKDFYYSEQAEENKLKYPVFGAPDDYVSPVNRFKGAVYSQMVDAGKKPVGNFNDFVYLGCGFYPGEDVSVGGK